MAKITVVRSAALATSGLPKLPPLPKAPRKHKAPDHPCACGCGMLARKRFVAGHDGRLRGWVLRVDRGLLTLADIPDGERQAVEVELRKQQAA